MFLVIKLLKTLSTLMKLKVIRQLLTLYLVFATNLASNKQICSDSKIVLKDVLIKMAHLIVKGGEGVSKFVTQC